MCGGGSVQSPFTLMQDVSSFMSVLSEDGLEGKITYVDYVFFRYIRGSPIPLIDYLTPMQNVSSFMSWTGKSDHIL